MFFLLCLGSVQAEVGWDQGQVPPTSWCSWAGPGCEECCELQQSKFVFCFFLNRLFFYIDFYILYET